MDLRRLLHVSHRPESVADLTTLEIAPRRLAVTGRTGAVERLADFPELEEVWLSDVNQEQLLEVASRIDPVILNIYNMRAPDLSPLAGFPRLEALAIEWNTKATDIDAIGQLPQLRALALIDLPKVRDLAPLSALTELRSLELSGGIWNTFKPHSLEPLGALTKLVELRLTNIRVGDDFLRPLESLEALRHLELSNQFPTEAYARLAAAMPRLRCSHLAAWVDLGDADAADGASGFVMIVGRGKPVLSRAKHGARIARYVAEFNELKKRSGG